jgi:hypothetical protein
VVASRTLYACAIMFYSPKQKDTQYLQQFIQRRSELMFVIGRCLPYRIRLLYKTTGRESRSLMLTVRKLRLEMPFVCTFQCCSAIPSVCLFYFSLSHSKVEVKLRSTVSRPICLGVGLPYEHTTRFFLFSLTIVGFFYVEHTL